MSHQLAEDFEASRVHLPPPFTLHRTTQRDVLAAAVALAPSEGAGTLVVHQSPGLLAFAVVFEPEQPLSEAQLAFLLGMTALGDALAAHCPPERPVRLIWPDQVTYDAARIGGGRFAIAPDTAEDGVPDWMVFAAELIADRDHSILELIQSFMQDAPQLILQLYILAKRPPQTKTENDYIITGELCSF